MRSDSTACMKCCSVLRVIRLGLTVGLGQVAGRVDVSRLDFTCSESARLNCNRGGFVRQVMIWAGSDRFGGETNDTMGNAG